MAGGLCIEAEKTFQEVPHDTNFSHFVKNDLGLVMFAQGLSNSESGFLANT